MPNIITLVPEYSKRSFIYLIIFTLFLLSIQSAFGGQVYAACSITVTNANSSGAGSLRQAITTANMSSDLDTICFNIAGSGVKVISPNTSPGNDLPPINQPVILDGTTQPGYLGTPLIEVNGSNAGQVNGFIVNAGSSTIRGLSIHSFFADGILIQTNGSNTITANHIGLNGTGNQDKGNGASGIGITSGNNTIGGSIATDRNVISGNNGNGLVISGASATGNVVKGNYIGTNATGTTSIGNSADGLLIVHAPNNIVGGTSGVTPYGRCSGDCNLLSGNGANGAGIWLSGASNNSVISNFIGVTPDGMSALPNGDIGLEIQDAANNTVGGITSDRRNVISGNVGAGVSLTSSLATNNKVIGNFIGVNTLGNTAIKNHKMGVNIGSTNGGSSNASGNIIGGTSGATPGGSCNGSCNVIAGNGWSGVYISGYNGGDNQIVGNFIGVGASGGWRIPNEQDGVGIVNSPNNRIGGPGSNARNLISGNGTNGIAIVGDSSTGTRIEGNYIGIATDQNSMGNNITGVAVGAGVDTAILANSIYGNGFLGIDVSLGGVNANDGGDADSGPNRLQNFPVLFHVIPIQGGLNIAGSLNSNANTAYRVEFFSSPACGSQGHGQGHTYLGSSNVITDATGNTGFSITLPITVAGGRSITSTATKLGGLTPFETSEFSRCVFTPRQHPDGALIRPSGSQNLFIVQSAKNGQLGSMQVLMSHFIDLNEFKTATSADTSAPAGKGLYFREGTLIKGSSPDVFVIDKTGAETYVKRKITSSQVFNELGYTYSDLFVVNDSALAIPDGLNISSSATHPDGTLVKNGITIYLIEDGKRRLVGSPGVYVSNRFAAAKLKATTSGDISLEQSSNVPYREGSLIKGSDPTVYVVDHDGPSIIKRRLGSLQAFIELGFTSSDIITVPNQELPANSGQDI